MFNNLKNLICISDEVILAKKQNTPIVALESTIITHGMPFPENYQTAIEAEALIRKTKSVPATIAVIKGQIKVGLSKNEINLLSRNKTVQKLSTNNLSIGITQSLTGSTTVAATLFLAELAKISVFATGGIGGVHRGSETDFDISTDLKQLSSSSCNVVCAGPKAILDIPKTVELIETFGIPLITYQNTNVPAFWSQDSRVKSPIVAETVDEIVQSYLIRKKLGLKAAQLICNPIPIEHEINAKTIEPIIEKSINMASKLRIKGKDLTPYLLSQVLQITQGKSLLANKALLFNNIDLATKIANTLSKF
ncbi:MAG: pseudouridine-5'-phosphate glycosidase [Paracoccaceae bacterium]|nr:pseudouridine-5'-phosphate glycosidase [Paracoccaceae bacterium]